MSGACIYNLPCYLNGGKSGRPINKKLSRSQAQVICKAIIELSIIEDRASASCRSGFSPTCLAEARPMVNRKLSRIMEDSIAIARRI